MNPMLDFSSDEEDEEDWMLDNLLKYKHLFTYKMEHLPILLKIHPDGTKIAIVCKTPQDKHEVLVFKLPDKLMTIDPVKEGLLNSRELTILKGLHLDQNPILDIEFVPGSQCSVMILHQDKLAMYEPDNLSDLLIFKQAFNVQRPKYLRISGGNALIITDDDDQEHLRINCKDFSLTLFKCQGLKTLLDFDIYAALSPSKVGLFNENYESVQELDLDLSKEVQKGSIKMIDEENAFLSFLAEGQKLIFGSCHKGKVKLTESEILLENYGQMTWSRNGQFMLIAMGNKIHILDRLTNKLFFTHECSKKASKVTAIATHPLLNHVVLSADDSKAVQAFWF